MLDKENPKTRRSFSVKSPVTNSSGISVNLTWKCSSCPVDERHLHASADRNARTEKLDQAD